MYDQINATYKTRFGELDSAHQFHLVTRLKLVCNDPWAATQVATLKNTVASDDPLLDLAAIRKHTFDPAQLNAPVLRAPLFKKHTWLYPYELMLFYALHCKTQYNLDATDTLSDTLSVTTPQIHELTNDADSLAILSTYLVNTYYLHVRLIQGSDEVIPLEQIDAALAVSLGDPNESRLKVYLLTHCIIGETLFYAREIPSNMRKYYISLADRLAVLLDDRWEELTIDARLEAAYCLKLLDTSPQLVQRAMRDAEKNYSSSDGYIIDGSSPSKNSINWAEHRNALYLMLAHRD